MSIFETAAYLAADLAGEDVDPNEAAKVLAYLRADRGYRNKRRLFDYLQAVTKNRDALTRTGRTASYYRSLLAACERHLGTLSAAQQAQALGWAIRLLRYYRAVPPGSRPQLPAFGSTTPADAAPLTAEVPPDVISEVVPQQAPPPPEAEPLKKLDIGVAITGNRKGEIRTSFGRGVRVDLNLKAFVVPKGKTVTGFIRKADAAGSVSGGFSGVIEDIEVDGATIYLIVKPVAKAKKD